MDAYDSEDDATSKESQNIQMSLEELFQYCVMPTISDSYWHILSLIACAFVFLLISRTSKKNLASHIV